MKYVIEIHELDLAPVEWNKKESWPHTGLFTVKNESYSLYHVSNESDSVGYISYQEIFKKTPYVDADAKLIAAAPELLEALKDAVQQLAFLKSIGVQSSTIDAEIRKSRAAIGKATGEQHE